jgi:vacuolar-type H+-ATPase catalytic subunit A/Vma1
MTAQYKWLPSEPTEEMMSVFAPLESYRTTVIKDGYKAMWQAAPDVESVQTLEELEQEIYENTQTFIPHKVMQWMLKRFYTHPQADQTALINQLTEELNKTEAARVKWMTMALTSQPKRATKDQEIAKFVSELTAIANEYQGTQQLRNRLRGVVLSFIEKYRSEPLNEIELKQIFEQSIGLKYRDFAKAIEKAHGIGV